MTTYLRPIALALAIASGAFPSTVFAGVKEGVAAYEAKDYATALTELQALAEQGDAKAQAYLGLMYAFGNGVPLDYAQALKWYRLAVVMVCGSAGSDSARAAWHTACLAAMAVEVFTASAPFCLESFSPLTPRTRGVCR